MSTTTKKRLAPRCRRRLTPAQIIGMNMIRHMAEKVVTPAALARLTDVDRMAISRYIAGKHEPSGSTLAKIAKALETTSESLLSIDTL